MSDQTDSDPAGADAGPPVTSGTALIICSGWWGFPAYGALAFNQLGWRVEVLCWYGQPLTFLKNARRIHRCSSVRPIAALAKAINRARPDLLVPCDDRSIVHLRQLYGRALAAGDRRTSDLIAASIGDVEASARVSNRADLINLARAEGIAAPAMLVLRSREDVRDAVATLRLPLMLKQDDSWGGIGVAKAETVEEAEQLFEVMRRPISTTRMIKRLLVDRDPFVLPQWFGRVRPRVNAQAFVDGTPANCLVACWRGEVVAALGVNVIRSSSAGGPATVVRVSNDPAMEDVARRLVRRLGFSGFRGFDFILENRTGTFHLIEMNQRMTPIGHLSLGPGRDPVAALAARVSGTAEQVRAPSTGQDIIALFPAAWLTWPDEPAIRNGYHDVPWSEPDLVRELVRLPWHERGSLVRLYRWLRRLIVRSAD
jgi:Carbamoyl-phosphate synthase L chain, ATP binding domain